MNFFYVLNGRSLKKSLIIIFAAFFTALILYVENMNRPTFSTPNGPRALYKAEQSSNIVSLTFNITWGDERALPILDVLKKQGIKNATFFLSASWAERHPQIVKRIKEDGHEIGSLGYNYVDYTQLEESKIRRDLAQAKKVFDTLGLKQVKLLRPPNGHFNNKVLKIADSFGYTVVHWSIDAKDWLNPGVETIVKNVTDEMEAGDIILLHASDSAKQTANALPSIIQSIKKKGYRSASISELIENGKINSKEIN